MNQHFFKFILFFLLLQGTFSARKVIIYWLNNGGSIISTFNDQIILKIATSTLPLDITCGDGNGFIYRPGTAKRFDNFYFPVDESMALTIIQHNIFSKDDAVTSIKDVKHAVAGFYNTLLSISQFQQGIGFGVQLMQGIDLTFNVESFTKTSDYYMLLKITNENIDKNDFHLPLGCKLSSSHLFGKLVFLILILLRF